MRDSFCLIFLRELCKQGVHNSLFMNDSTRNQGFRKFYMHMNLLINRISLVTNQRQKRSSSSHDEAKLPTICSGPSWRRETARREEDPRLSGGITRCDSAKNFHSLFANEGITEHTGQHSVCTSMKIHYRRND